MRVIRLRFLGFSLVELVVVALILGVIASTALPRFSRGSEGVADAALAGNLAVLRNGLDLYASDHAGNYPSVANFEAQMTEYTDEKGNTSTVQDSTHTRGPYLRKVPLLPVGPKGFRGASAVLDAATAKIGAEPGAWIYNPKTGEIHANLDFRIEDYSGKRYNQY